MSSTLSNNTPAPVTLPTLTNDMYLVRRCRSPSFNYHESPPSPPPTLQDGMHDALKLNGIKETDNQILQMEQVKDEDFMSCSTIACQFTAV